jgi:hypothetical protein
MQHMQQHQPVQFQQQQQPVQPVQHFGLAPALRPAPPA